MAYQDYHFMDTPDLDCSHSLRDVLDNAREAHDALFSKEAIFSLMDIDMDIGILEQELEEQKKMHKLCEESSALNQMIFKTKDNLKSLNTESSQKRRLE